MPAGLEEYTKLNVARGRLPALSWKTKKGGLILAVLAAEKPFQRVAPEDRFVSPKQVLECIAQTGLGKDVIDAYKGLSSSLAIDGVRSTLFNFARNHKAELESKGRGGTAAFKLSKLPQPTKYLFWQNLYNMCHPLATATATM